MLLHVLITVTDTLLFSLKYHLNFYVNVLTMILALWGLSFPEVHLPCSPLSQHLHSLFEAQVINSCYFTCAGPSYMELNIWFITLSVSQPLLQLWPDLKCCCIFCYFKLNNGNLTLYLESFRGCSRWAGLPSHWAKSSSIYITISHTI